MGRRKIEGLAEKVSEYIDKAMKGEPEKYPLSLRGVGKACKCSPTTLKSHNLHDDINQASDKREQRLQISKSLNNPVSERDRLLKRIKELEETEKKLNAEIFEMTANAQQLGCLPKLRKPLEKPDRKIRCYTKKKSRK